MEDLWSLYHEPFPAFLRDFMETPPLARLRDVGMNCGCEYTDFPLYRHTKPYSRFDHSVGVALILWHFTGSPRQTVAGLLHDVATPVFAHVVDFLNGDHLRQESTEARTSAVIRQSPELLALLKREHLTVEDVADYHRYPLADNPSPQLSADRLEYTLGNLWHYGFLPLDQLAAFYGDLAVGGDEQCRQELAFQTPETASAFTRASLETSRVYVSDEDRFAMQALADLLRDALARGILTTEDLYTTEPAVIARLRGDPVSGAAWEHFRSYTGVLRADRRPQEEGWLSVPAKKRYIDPLIRLRGRVSQWDPQVKALQEEFLALDFSCWLRGCQ